MPRLRDTHGEKRHAINKLYNSISDVFTLSEPLFKSFSHLPPRTFCRLRPDGSREHSHSCSCPWCSCRSEGRCRTARTHQCLRGSKMTVSKKEKRSFIFCRQAMHSDFFNVLRVYQGSCRCCRGSLHIQVCRSR